MRLSIFLSVFLAASPALAQDRDYDSVLALHLRLGFAGSASSSTGGFVTDADLDTTIGIGLRAEVPLLPFLSFGGFFEAASFRTDIAFFNDESHWGLDFDVWIRGRWLFTFDDVALEPYLALPVGFSIGFLPDPEATSDDEAWPGWNIGVMAGTYVVSAIGIGGLFEIGFRHHEAYNSSDTVFGDDHSASSNEFAMNIGVLFALW